MRTKIIIFIAIAGLVFFSTIRFINAAALPLPGVELLFKSITTKQVTLGKADNDGNFTTAVPEENGIFDIYVGDENTPPVKITAKGKIISGRVVILTEGTTTKDPAPLVVKKVTPIKKKVVTLLKEGEICKTSSQCAKGLKCAYPCGIQGCKNVCTKESAKDVPKI